MRREKGLTVMELLQGIFWGSVAIILLSWLLMSFTSVGLYGWFFAKDLDGRLVSVDYAMPDGVVVGGRETSIFQASVIMETKDGSYQTFSTDDRQWASLLGDKAAGKCASVRIYPYAPWAISKSGTYHGGRLLAIRDC